MSLCKCCNQQFEPTTSRQVHCSKKCKERYNAKRTYDRNKLIPKTNCIECDSPTGNKKFCSPSCSATYNNRLRRGEKRAPNQTRERGKKTYYCKNCDCILRVGYSKTEASIYCDKCRYNTSVNKNYVDWSLVTKSEFRSRFSNVHQFHARMRSLARSKKQITPCVVCGYDKHVDVCHIKPVAKFDDSSSIAQINDASNLVCLCPNHHWEFDNLGLELVAGARVALA